MNKIKSYFKYFLVFTLVVLTATGCLPADKKAITNEDINLIQFEKPNDGQDIAIFDTDLGTIKMMLFKEEAPQTVSNFINLANDGFYKDKPFFAVDKSARTVMSGATDEFGKSGIVYGGSKDKIEPELSPNLWHFTGAVSTYGKSAVGNPYITETDSRFFFVGTQSPSEHLTKELIKRNYPQKVLDKYEEVGGQIDFTGAYTVFGQIYEGLDFIDKLIKSAVLEEGTVKPVDKILIKKVTIEQYSSK